MILDVLDVVQMMHGIESTRESRCPEQIMTEKKDPQKAGGQQAHAQRRHGEW
jgi:hypothetical protein